MLELEGFGSLITVKDTTQCLGSLIIFDGRGVYDPNYGRVDVPVEHVDAHNHALDEACLKGMDENCKIGQAGFAYYQGGQVITFTGIVIASNPVVKVNGKVITFERKNKVYRGRLCDDADHFNFKRVK